MQLCKMEAVFTSSRGTTIEPLIRAWHPRPALLKFQATPCAKLQDLWQDARNFLLETPDPTNCHVYFVAGLCDLTLMERIGLYQEVYFMESAEEATARVNALIDQISIQIQILGAKPCFATVIPMSLRDWNFIRLSQHKTTHIMHHHQYDDMQALLNEATLAINRHINTTNRDNHMETPQLADTILTHRRNAPTRFHYNRLADGVHPTPDLTGTWASCLRKCIENNRYAATPHRELWQRWRD